MKLTKQNLLWSLLFGKKGGGGTTPSGAIDITSNGDDIDVAPYATANVNVARYTKQTIADCDVIIASSDYSKKVTFNAGTDEKTYVFWDISVDGVSLPWSAQTNNYKAYDSTTGYTYEMSTSGYLRVTTGGSTVVAGTYHVVIKSPPTQYLTCETQKSYDVSDYAAITVNATYLYRTVTVQLSSDSTVTYMNAPRGLQINTQRGYHNLDVIAGSIPKTSPVTYKIFRTTSNCSDLTFIAPSGKTISVSSSGNATITPSSDNTMVVVFPKADITLTVTVT